MGRALSLPQQPDLLAWQAPDPVLRFEDVAVRAATLTGRISKAVAASLVTFDRRDVSMAMTAYLGRPVSKAMLDAYASEAREDHVIPMPRFIALVNATGDRRLLEILAEPMGWAVIERRYLPLIELAAVQERQDDLRRQGDALRRRAKLQGVL